MIQVLVWLILEGFLNDPLVLELYENFNGYFSLKECARAINFNRDDI